MIGDRKEINKFILFRLAKIRRKFFKLRMHLKKNVFDSISRRKLIKETREIEKNMEIMIEIQREENKSMFREIKAETEIKEKYLRIKILSEISERRNK